MPRGRPLAPLTLTDDQRDQLDGIARSATLPYALVQRARMILASADGMNNSARRSALRRHTANRRQVATALPRRRHRGSARRTPTRSAPDV